MEPNTGKMQSYPKNDQKMQGHLYKHSHGYSVKAANALSNSDEATRPLYVPPPNNRYGH